MASSILQSIKDAAEPGQLRRLTVALVFTLPLVAVAMGPHILMLFGIGSGSMDDMSGMEGMEGMEGMPGMEGMDTGDSGGDMQMSASNAWLQLVLATPVVLYSGAPFFQRAWHGYRQRSPTMDILVAIGVTASFGYSLVATLSPGSVPTQDLYYETAAVIITLVLVGRLVERMARRRATATLRGMLAGTDSSPVTGSDQATWLRLLEDAQVSRTAAQRVLDRLVSRFVPIVLLIATLASIYWMTAGAPLAERAGLSGYEMSVLSLVGVVIVACPCALGLATPLAVASATGKAAKQGILIRGGHALDAAHGIDTLVFNEADGLAHGAHATAAHLPETIRDLGKRGIQVRLMTAEPSTIAVDGLQVETVAEQDKAAHLSKLQAEGLRVAVVTDSRRPVAGAQLTIATGLADSADAQPGDIVLPQPDPQGVAIALEIAGVARRRIWQNLAWAFGYNVVLVPVAAGLLVAWPLFGDAVVFDPMLGAAAMTLSILSVIANSTRGGSPAKPAATPVPAPASAPGA